MKKGVLFILSCVLLWNCSEGGMDCFQKQGEIITEEISVEFFDKISIATGIELVVKEAEEQEVKIEAGKNLIGDIKVKVENGELKIRNNNGCEMLRNYHPATIYVSTPVLEKIYSSSQYSVRSDGVLTFPELSLESGIIADTPLTIFEMEIQNQKITINDNISSVFKIRGSTEYLGVYFWGSNGRLEAENLTAQEVGVYHRSTNDMIVFPVQKVSGIIASTGNLVLKNLPPIVEVEQLYTGHVVYP